MQLNYIMQDVKMVKVEIKNKGEKKTMCEAFAISYDIMNQKEVSWDRKSFKEAKNFRKKINPIKKRFGCK